MSRFLSSVVVAALLVAAPLVASAQTAPKIISPPSGPPVTIATPAAPAREPERPSSIGLTNIQVEITLTDQVASGTPIKKTVSLITAVSSMGRIRAEASGFDQTLGRPVQIALNVDAMPRLMQGDLIQLNLTIEYRPLKVDGKSEGANQTQLNQSLTVNMTSGKAVIVSQAADPANDRKIVVEAKATILK